MLLLLAPAFAAEMSGLEATDLLLFSRDPVQLRPQFALTEVFNDNLFYNSGARIDDFITIVSPGLELQIGRVEKNFLMFQYLFSQYFYAEQSDLDTGEHTFSLQNQLRGQRLGLSGSDSIQFLSSPLGGIERTLTRGNVDRVSFSDRYTVDYALTEKTTVYVEGQHTAQDYESGTALYDHRTLQGTVGFGLKALPKTSFFGELYYGQTETTPNDRLLVDNPDAQFFGGFLGARGEFTQKLSGTAKLGYEQFEFDDNGLSSGAPVFDMTLTERFTEKTALSLTYSRRHNVSIQSNGQAYVADIVSVRLGQALGSSCKWVAALGGSYGLYSYEKSRFNTEFADTLYSGFFNLEYRIQLWLTASLGYNYERVDRERAGAINYDVNRVTLRLALGY